MAPWRHGAMLSCRHATMAPCYHAVMTAKGGRILRRDAPQNDTGDLEVFRVILSVVLRAANQKYS